MVHELTINQVVQKNLHDEIAALDRVLKGKSPTKDNLYQLKYMDMVVHEVLRRWPVSPITDCIVKRPYLMEMSDGTSIELNEGDGILFPLHALHMDAEYFCTPERFDPERFAETNCEKFRAECYFPFGIETADDVTHMALKVAIYNLLMTYELQRCNKTQNSLQLDKGGVSRRGVWTKIKVRSK